MNFKDLKKDGKAEVTNAEKYEKIGKVSSCKEEEEHMPEERKKGKHLTWEDRHEIQRGLRYHRTFTEIGEIIGCSPDTVSKEIRKHRYHKPVERIRATPNRCKHRDTCRKRNICKKKGQKQCLIPCRECTLCNKRCPDFVDAPCPVESKAPYVCNACPKSRTCFFDKYLYNADYAHREYLETLSKAREGINLTKDELVALDELVSPLIKKGQPIAHILTEHAEELPCKERTLYNYISKGYLTAKSIDMRRSVRYKKRKKKETDAVKTCSRKKIGHQYKDFLEWLEADATKRVVEMDTVEGSKGGKLLQTLFWRQEKLMLAYLLGSKEMAGTAGTLDRLEELLGKELFELMFPVILTDNGNEFADPELFEFSQDGTRRTTLFYCEPRRSEQKGGIEKNHEYIRYIIPKGKSFDDLTQEKVTLMMNHINSTARPGLQGKNPMQLALQCFGNEAMDRLGLTLISPDEVNLTPKLLK